MRAPTFSLRRLDAVTPDQLEGLADVLQDCVAGGASVSFMHPLPRERALDFWRSVAEDTAAGRRALLVAEDAQGVCGTVQLCWTCRRTSRTAPTCSRCWYTGGRAGKAWARP